MVSTLENLRDSFLKLESEKGDAFISHRLWEWPVGWKGDVTSHSKAMPEKWKSGIIEAYTDELPGRRIKHGIFGGPTDQDVMQLYRRLKPHLLRAGEIVNVDPVLGIHAIEEPCRRWMIAIHFLLGSKRWAWSKPKRQGPILYRVSENGVFDETAPTIPYYCEVDDLLMASVRIIDRLLFRGDQKNEPACGGGDETRHSLDFRSVRWFGTNYIFTPLQAACIKVLWENWERGTPELDQRTILETAGSNQDQERLNQVFDKGQHPAWKAMIFPGGTKGAFRLADPTEPK